MNWKITKVKSMSNAILHIDYNLCTCINFLMNHNYKDVITSQQLTVMWSDQCNLPIISYWLVKSIINGAKNINDPHPSKHVCLHEIFYRRENLPKHKKLQQCKSVCKHVVKEAGLRAGCFVGSIHPPIVNTNIY